MAGRIPLEGEIVFLENNRYRQQPIIQVNEENVSESEADLISLEAVGTALRNITKYSVIFDYIGMYHALKEAFVFKIGEKEFIITEDVLKRLIIILVIALILPAVALLLIASGIEKKEKEKLDQVNNEIQSVESKISEIKKLTDENKNNFDEKAEIEKVIKSNKAKIKLYSAMGESVPKNLWITYFTAKGEGKVDISGVSNNVEDIYVFYKNMKDSLLDSQLRLQKLEMENASVDDVITSSQNYVFEITNMTEAELNPPKEKDGDSKGQEASNGDNPDENNDNAANDKKNKKDKKDKKDKGAEVKDLEEVEVH